MRRLRWIPVLAAALAVLPALPARAYQHLSQRTAVSGVSPDHWEHFPIDLVVDADRPELAACLAYVRPGDTLVVPSLDRLSRSLADLITLVGRLCRQGGRVQ